MESGSYGQLMVVVTPTIKKKIPLMSHHGGTIYEASADT